ncbi:MAG TPA: phage/plasmid primase, P4 family [Bryobacteraceae bacterium]|nr:phage/plasmid primase, P4 family [Bryobacteraceae bacterium]
MIDDRTLISDLAGVIAAADHFARWGSRELYRYQGGVFRAGGEWFVRQRVKHLLGEFHKLDRWHRRLADEVIEFLLLDAPELPLIPPAEVLNLENGLFHIWDQRLRPHSPAFLSTIRIPVAYRETATCPAIETFVHQVFPADCLELVWEILGDLITPERSIQKAACLVGGGGNGKSTFLQLASRFVGLDNVCHLSLQRLERDRFAAARLFGKLANICPDLPSEPLVDSAVFKSITGGDRITAEQKYRDSFEFTPFVRLLFSANQLPVNRYSSRAYCERWLIIPFERSFRNTRREIPRQVLDQDLSRPDELSGALNCALPAIRRLRASGRFSAGPRTVLRPETCVHRDDPCLSWLETEIQWNPAALMAQDELYGGYAQSCREQNRPPLTKQMFGRMLREWRPNLQEAQRVLDGRRQWVYLGLERRNGHAAPYPSPESLDISERYPDQ